MIPSHPAPARARGQREGRRGAVAGPRRGSGAERGVYPIAAGAGGAGPGTSVESVRSMWVRRVRTTAGSCTGISQIRSAACSVLAGSRHEASSRSYPRGWRTEVALPDGDTRPSTCAAGGREVSRTAPGRPGGGSGASPRRPERAPHDCLACKIRRSGLTLCSPVRASWRRPSHSHSRADCRRVAPAKSVPLPERRTAQA
jgi:hypothetical protein